MSARRVLVTGAAGMLGSQVSATAPEDCEILGTDLREGPGVEAPGIDLADRDDVRALWQEHGPFAGLIHCAAFTAVDRAEQEEEAAYRANATACAVLAEQASRERVPMVLLSTDFVFDGKGRRPYNERDEPSPLSAYGRTKLAGERAALEAFGDGVRIVRTQWLYGPRGTHFPGTIVRLARERGRLKVVNDQVGSPTTTLELAPALWDVLDRAPAGIYHAACEGSCSWYELAAATLAGVGLDEVVLEPCTSAEFPRPAQRPAYSVLDCSALAALRGRTLLSWTEALRAYLAVDPL